MRLPLPLVIALAGTGVVISVACKRGDNVVCKEDGDCGQASFCRDQVCTDIERDDAGVDEGGAPISCVTGGGACTSDDDCCTRPCTGFRCAGGASSSGRTSSSSGASGTSGTSNGGTSSGSTSSGGNCTDLYGLCSGAGDCCTGLSCDSNGTCR